MEIRFCPVRTRSPQEEKCIYLVCLRVLNVLTLLSNRKDFSILTLPTFCKTRLSSVIHDPNSEWKIATSAIYINRPVGICEVVLYQAPVLYPIHKTFTRSGSPFWLISLQTVKMLISHIRWGEHIKGRSSAK